MAKFQGQVFKVYEKTFSGKPSYSIKLEDNPIYFRTNAKRFAGIAEPGNMIEFEAEMNADGKSANVQGDITKMAKAAAAAASAASPAGARDTSIQYQSARKDALQLVQILLTAGAVKLPAKQAAQVSVIESITDKYTALFFEDIATLGAVTRANGDDGEGKEAAAPTAKDDDEE